jgi:Tfp pilus assembly protein PilN
VKAVNLIPADARRQGVSASARSLGPSHAIVALLAVAAAFVAIAVLTKNTINDRKATLAGLQTQVAQVSAAADRLGSYTQFEQMAQQRAETVREIAASRFDWDGALTDMSRVIAANTSLTSLVGSVVPGAGSGGSSLRSAISAPAFELTGCTKTQDDVARLLSRLRVINGVTRVTLSTSTKSDSSQTNGHGRGCPANWPVFDLVVFFTPVPGAGPQGLAAATATPVATTATPTTSTTGTAATTPPAATTPSAVPGTTTTTGVAK